jgi:hypothetical protein
MTGLVCLSMYWGRRYPGPVSFHTDGNELLYYNYLRPILSLFFIDFVIYYISYSYPQFPGQH